MNKRRIKSKVRIKAWIFEYDQYSFELNILILTLVLGFLIGGVSK